MFLLTKVAVPLVVFVIQYLYEMQILSGTNESNMFYCVKPWDTEIKKM